MKAFFELEIDRWENTRWSEVPLKSYVKERLIHEETYPPPIVDRLRAYLRDAAALAPEGSLHRKRIDWYTTIHQPFFEESRLWHHWRRRRVVVSMPQVAAGQTKWWQGVQAHPLMESAYGKEPKTRSQITMAHDGTAMLLHAILPDADPAQIKADATVAEPDRVADDDHLKICFDFDDRAYYHYIAVNAGGVTRTGVQAIPLEIRGLDLPGLHKEWPVQGIRADAKVAQKGWTVNVTIPFTALSEWGFDKNALQRGIRFQIVRRKTTTPAETTLLCPTLQPVWSFPTTRFAVGEFVPRQ
jgi:hypothetical protein